MGRPKGSKNKATAQPKEFVYEESDSLYQQVMSSGAVGPDNHEEDAVVDIGVNIETPTQPAPVVAPARPAATVAPVISSIYLVEGKVRLDQDGSPPVFADQRRIVNAGSVDEALQKFVQYFVAMSNPIQQYTVVQAGASETIL